jgi:DNA-nicking Smr family endonuclease
MAKPRSRQGGAAAPGAAASGAADGTADNQDRDSEEARLFRAAVSDVIPLPAPAHPAHGATLPAPRRRTRRHAPSVEPESPGAAALGEVVAADDAPGVATPSAADPLSFRRPGVRDQTLRQLRRGRYPVEDELDLHGLNQAAARDQLAEFIASSSHAGLRCVRVVHGKGYRSGARGPVLKIAVNTWLKRHADVLAFTSARAIDGGTGAVYVLLR